MNLPEAVKCVMERAKSRTPRVGGSDNIHEYYAFKCAELFAGMLTGQPKECRSIKMYLGRLNSLRNDVPLSVALTEMLVHARYMLDIAVGSLPNDRGYERDCRAVAIVQTFVALISSDDMEAAVADRGMASVLREQSP